MNAKYLSLYFFLGIAACSEPTPKNESDISKVDSKQCFKDTDCKGERICDAGVCKNPSDAKLITPSSEKVNKNQMTDTNFSKMMGIYNNPKTAPEIKSCRGDINCNAFIALANQWESIPDDYRYRGDYDIKAYAKKGDTYDDQGRNIGLSSGFNLQTDKSLTFVDGVEKYIEM